MKPKRIVVLPLALLALGAAALFLLRHGNGDPTTLVASGTVESTEARLAFPVSGRIEAMAVQEGDRVEGGQDVARLDQAEIAARREQAVAQVDAAASLLRELRSGSRPEEVAQARAAAAAAAERLVDAERDLDRTKRLHEGGAVSREAWDKAVTARDIAKSQSTQAAEHLRLVERGPRAETIDAQRARLAQAEAAVRTLDAARADMTLRSPFAGVVSVRHREPGETVAPGTAVVTVTNREDRWVRIYVPEDRIGALETGLNAAITADTFPRKTYAGRVIFIAPEAEFTPKNVQTTEERVKLVYAVKVRITGDPTHDLKPGLAADVKLHLRTP
jgi:HlyD family secretion protein